MTVGNRTCLNSTGYEFIRINSPEKVALEIESFFEDKNIFGTVYVSVEGINVNLAGNENTIKSVEELFYNHNLFKNILFKHTYSHKPPFRKLKVKVKPEIISIKKEISNIFDIKKNYIEPKELEEKLDNGENVFLLDTRNNYEINIGSFKNAKNLNILKFDEFAEKVDEIKEIDGEVVMFCTGGIRCEKALGYLNEEGINSFKQLKGGIINYLNETEGKHWDGECFVFDDRITLDKDLKPTYKKLCPKCQQVINAFDRTKCEECR
tara:strand:- start:3127 stop:3921 length:795 start_codon:yes stop_codon:yes gene_type:complete